MPHLQTGLTTSAGPCLSTSGEYYLVLRKHWTKYHARQYPAGGCGEVSCAALRLPPAAAGAAHLPPSEVDLQHPRLLCAPLRHPYIRLLDIRCHYQKIYLIVEMLLKVNI